MDTWYVPVQTVKSTPLTANEDRAKNPALVAGALAGALKGPILERCSARAPVRRAYRPARTQAAVLRHAYSLPPRHGGHGLLMGFPKLRLVPLSHQGRHWRRVYGHCLDHSGVRAGAISRLDRSHHQRQLLDWRSARRSRLDRATRSRIS